jgi:hypothetical protein
MTTIRAQVRSHREIAARDVVADAARRNVIAVADDAADRHGVPEMTVGAQYGRRAVLGRGAAFELLDRRLVVLPEDPHRHVKIVDSRISHVRAAGVAQLVRARVS